MPRLLKAEKPALVLLDLMLPGTDGIELMNRVPGLAALPVPSSSPATAATRRWRGRWRRARPTTSSNPSRQRSSPRGCGRRCARRAEPEPFEMGALAIDYERRRVTVAGREVALTATQYELLRVLSVKPGRVWSYEALLGEVWGGEQGRPGQGARHCGRSFAASSATTRPGGAGCSTSAASATACQGRTNAERPSRGGARVPPCATVFQALEHGEDAPGGRRAVYRWCRPRGRGLPASRWGRRCR